MRHGKWLAYCIAPEGCLGIACSVREERSNCKATMLLNSGCDWKRKEWLFAGGV
jgi:hypothetical protein